MSNDELISKAYEAMKNSYAPYSKFNVGAVALCGEKIYIGCNIENASFGATICAERCAIFKAVSDGCTKIDKIVIVCSTHDFAYPCGICRQVMSEFMNSDGIIILENHGLIKKFKLDELLPHSFGACDIKTE